MHQKFGRRLQDRERFGYEFQTEFQVESYLRHQGLSFTQRFDANSYLYITKAMDYFDLSQSPRTERLPANSLAAAFAGAQTSNSWSSASPATGSTRRITARRLSAR